MECAAKQPFHAEPLAPMMIFNPPQPLSPGLKAEAVDPTLIIEDRMNGFQRPSAFGGSRAEPWPCFLGLARSK